MPPSSVTSNAPEQARALFEAAFGGAPAVVASAPGRVNLIGEHLDYNGGPVMPVALERRTAVAAAPADEWTMVSAIDDAVVARDPNAPMGAGWTDYLAGVARELRIVGGAPRAAKVAVATSVPVGAGLSSSAALTVAGAAALAALAGRTLTPAELADVAYRAEHDQVGVRCGRMDQTIAAHAREGHAILFDTSTGEITHAPFPGEFWIVETGVSHRLTGGELNARRRECEQALASLRRDRPGLHALAQLTPADLDAVERRLGDAVLFRRVRHVVTEAARTRDAALALVRGDRVGLGGILYAGHASLREDYESTIAEADAVVDSARRHGALGARLTGAGWGGAVVLLPPPGEGEAISALIARDFERSFGSSPVAWSSRAAGGARVEEVAG